MKRWVALVAATGLLVACSGDDRNEPTAITLGAPIEVGTTAHTPYNLSVGADDDLVAVAWNDYDDAAATEAPYVATSTDGGTTFGAPVLVDPENPYVAYPQVAVAAGTIFVGATLYEQDEADGRPALYASTDSGASFVKVADLTESPRVLFTAVGTTIAVSPDGKTVVMAWSSPSADGATAELVGVVSTDGGTTWSEPAVLGQAGAGRPRAYAGPDGAGVAAIVMQPLDDPPAPTPANPNPVTASAEMTVIPVDGDSFGQPTVIATEGVVDEGPGASADSSTVTAWWQAVDSGAGLQVMMKPGGSAVAVQSGSLPRTAPAEVAAVSGGAWVLTIEVPEGDGVEPASLALFRVPDGGTTLEAGDFPSKVTRSGEEYDVAALSDGAAFVVWFDDGTVQALKATA